MRLRGNVGIDATMKWIGSSIASSLPNFPAVTKGEYEENGAEVIHTKINVFRP